MPTVSASRGGTASNGTAVTRTRTEPGRARCSSTTWRSATRRSRWRGRDNSETARCRRKARRRSTACVVAASDIGINVIAPARLTFAGQILGPGRMRLVHDGTFVFANPNNTYTGGRRHRRRRRPAHEGGRHGERRHPARAGAERARRLEPDDRRRRHADADGPHGPGHAAAHQPREPADPERQRRHHVRAAALSGSGIVRHTGGGHQQFTGSLASFAGQLIVDNGLVTVSTIDDGGVG